MLSEEDFKLGYLSLSGKINFDDLWNIKYKLPLLVSLDMGQCSYETDASEAFPGLNTRRFLKYVVLPYNLTAIGQGAFANTSIEEIIIPEGVQAIGFGAFQRCTKLKNILFPSSLQMLAPVCFDGCTSLVEIKIPSQIKELPQSIFSNCENLKSISFERNILEIGDYAFDGCSKLESFNTGNNLVSIGQRAFAECISLKNINFPPSLIGIGVGAFWNDYSLEKIVIPHSVESIGHSAFYNCTNASELILSDKLTDIYESTFMTCNGYASLRLGKQIKDIGPNAFSGNYTELYLNSKLKHVSSFGLSSNSLINIYTPATSSFTLDEDGFGVVHKNFYIPGKTTETFSDIIDTNIIEMWDYQHHRADRRVMIAPAIKDIVIDMVTINGEIVVPTNDIYYYYTPDNNDTDNLDVVIDYTLHGRQTMTTHYDKDFNASLPDTDFSLVKEIVLSSNSITLYPGKKSQISANILPENAENKTLIWSTSDENIATVNAEGKVTAIAVGEATITVTAADGSGVSAACQVTVNPIMVETLTINPETWSGTEGKSFQITAVVTPEDATDKTVAWSSSDETVAIVDATGYVNVLKGGNCVITASTQDGSGLSAECIITCISGIDNIFTDASTRFDVYNLQGILVKKDCCRDDLKQLSTGAYILRLGNVSKKIIIR